MSWSAVQTWVNGTIVTDSMLNQQLRDNTQYLKDVLDGIQNQNIILGNAFFLYGKDNGQTPRELIGVDASNNVLLRSADTHGWVLQRNDGTLLGTIDNNGNIASPLAVSHLLVNPYRVHRHPFANDRHIEAGTTNMGSCAAGTPVDSGSITFTAPFAIAPLIVATINTVTGAEQTKCIATIKTPTATNFKIRVVNNDGTTATQVVVNWIAEGNN